MLAHSRARFCSSRCRTAAHRAGVPGELRRRPRWVRWTGRKRPQTVDGRIASSTDPETWATYQAARRSTAGVGLGFVLNGDGIVCLDLDGCLADGVPNAATQLLLELAGRTYVEISPSGRGLHVWGRGELAAGRCTTFRGQPVELYGSGRYITVTGVRFPGAGSTLGDLSPALATVLTSSSHA
ncbi:bifunctional DNA primase/polymerase [Pseudonocardia asaccharolytica]|uniref:DNA primase/polymerase bifunctional N-terminal domain-containing protein n=1 Tax=Pseudonocardia asaccharolytica DSM 44247 = NBRC 16224 TaxID=1123024 RepID=A0A511D8S9_9PSEU|nr:bifunctional DNA primase/polymerase [Pseudonocardia asaccharolytica]GEL19348.1 hypothetical protein PA7_31850 [Pseudonocardia asaccharolytica DSM 44247 = NBRC 16224]